MSRDIDYASVELPREEPPENWHYTARRALIYQLIEKRGTPAAINQSEVARKFEVTPQNINNDMQVLREYIAERDDDDRATATAKTIYPTAVRELAADGEWRAAVQCTNDWMSWLQDTGQQERAPERHEVEVGRLDGDRAEREGLQLVELDEDDTGTYRAQMLAAAESDRDTQDHD